MVAVTKTTDRCLKHDRDLFSQLQHLSRASVTSTETQFRVLAGLCPLHRLQERVLCPLVVAELQVLLAVGASL